MIKNLKLAVVVFEGQTTGFVKFKARDDGRIFRFGGFEIVQDFHMDCLVGPGIAKDWCNGPGLDPRYSIREVTLSVDLPPSLKLKLE